MIEHPSTNGKHSPGTVPLEADLLLPLAPSDAARRAAPAVPLRRVIVGSAAPPAASSASPAAVPATAARATSGPALALPGGAVARGTRSPRTVGLAVAGLLALVLVGVVVWTASDLLNPNRGVGPLLAFADQGHTHIAPGEPHPPYNSDPATSGWHREEWAPAHVMTTSVASEVSVHLLEHGNVGIFYDCSSGDCPDLQRQLTDLVQTQLAARAGDGIYLFPQALPDHHKIALASWMHLQYLDRFQADAIRQFITTFIGAVKE